MERVMGVGASTGCAMGQALLLTPREQRVRKKQIVDPKAELARLSKAKDIYAQELRELYDRTLEHMGKEEADIFTMYGELLEDPVFLPSIERRVETECIGAEYAVHRVAQELSAAFTQMEDEYMRARGADIENVSYELIHRLKGTPADSAVNRQVVDIILVVDDLTPASIVNLDRRRIKGIVMQHGSRYSHTSILARAMAIPTVVGVQGALRKMLTGQSIALNGATGEVVMQPDEAVSWRYRMEILAIRTQRNRYQEAARDQAVTLDGKSIKVAVNILRTEDLGASDWRTYDGVGLYRTEFLFLTSGTSPSEQDQYLAYKSAAQQAAGQDVIISVADLGEDRQAEYMAFQQEPNPHLGYRAIRVSLDRPELFKTQLRAILRASIYGQVKLVLPMITSLWELRMAKELLHEAMSELSWKRIPYNRSLPVGVMVETPASVMMIDELIQECDFVSIGSRDLIQYTLAVDRTNPLVAPLYDSCHVSVLRSIVHVVRSAQRAEKPVYLCGDAAAQRELIPLWAALGIDMLSVSVPSAAMVKHRLRHVDTSRVSAGLDRLLSCGTAEDVRALMYEFERGSTDSWYDTRF